MLKRRFRSAAIVVFAAIAMLAPAAHAAKSPDLSANERAVVQKINDYINSIHTLKGEFTQISPKGRISNGVFYISKPGKLRFEYAPPNPFLIVSDGTWLTVQNRKHGKQDQYPLSKTPLRLMLSQNIDLFSEAIVRELDVKDDIITIALEDRDQLVAGHLILVFNDKTRALQQWVVVDGQGRRTTVSLGQTEAGVDPDPKLFRVNIKNRNKPKVDR